MVVCHCSLVVDDHPCPLDRVGITIRRLFETLHRRIPMNLSPATTTSHSAHPGAGPGRASLVKRFVLHFVEMSIPMALGMVVFGLLAHQL
jgi:hypothetical protein